MKKLIKHPLMVLCLFIGSTMFAQSKKIEINRRQFVGSYQMKTDLGGGEIVVFPTTVIISKGKLEFVVNEGGSMNIYYNEISGKEIKKNIEYHFKASNPDIDTPTTFRFKKKGNRFELIY